MQPSRYQVHTQIIFLSSLEIQESLQKCGFFCTCKKPWNERVLFNLYKNYKEGEKPPLPTIVRPNCDVSYQYPEIYILSFYIDSLILSFHNHMFNFHKITQPFFSN